MPCLSGEVESFCCGHGYECLSNRLCRGTAESDRGDLVRGTCTDKSWQYQTAQVLVLVGRWLYPVWPGFQAKADGSIVQITLIIRLEPISVHPLMSIITAVILDVTAQAMIPTLQ